MNIALDLDGTLLQTHKLFENVFKSYKLKYFHPISYDMINYPKEIRDTIIDMFTNDDYKTYQLPLFSEVRKTLDSWKARHNLYIVTARHNVSKTRSFVSTLLDIKEDNVFVTHDKLPILQDLNINLWIDDNPSDLVKIQQNSLIRCIMMSRESTVYNHYLRGQFEWVNSLDEIIV